MYLNYSRAEHFSMCMERSLQGRGTRLTTGQKLELFRGTAGVIPLQSVTLEKSALHVMPSQSSCETQLKCKLL